MHRHRYIVAKSVIVQDIDAEKQHDIDQPSAQRNAVWLEEKRRSCAVELRRKADDGHEEELDKGKESPFTCGMVSQPSKRDPQGAGETYH